jgi:hypothetical protein
MTVLCCGDRLWSSRSVVRDVLRSLPSGKHHIIHGAAAGADTIAGEEAKALGHAVTVHPADWHQYGRAAGPIRNDTMLREHPDIERVYAFHDDLTRSKGTNDMIRRARAKGIWVANIRSDGAALIAV